MKAHIFTGPLALAFMAAAVLVGSAIHGQSEVFASDQIVEIPEQTVTETVEIPNPWVECGDIEDAEKTAGFSFFFAPEDFGKDFELTGCRTIPQILLEADYSDGEQTITVRQAPGSNDISGDYNTYDTEEIEEVPESVIEEESEESEEFAKEETETEETGVNEEESAKEETEETETGETEATEGLIKVTLRKKDGQICSAIFTDGEYSFSIYAEKGISEDSIREVVKAVEERMAAR